MDALINELYNVSVQILPILGVVALVFVIVFLRKLILLLNDLSETTKKVNTTLDIVDRELNDLQGPINTVVSLSATVDYVHESTIKTAKSMIVYILSNIDTVKNWFMDAMAKYKSNKVDKEEQQNDTE